MRIVCVCVRRGATMKRTGRQAVDSGKRHRPATNFEAAANANTRLPSFSVTAGDVWRPAAVAPTPDRQPPSVALPGIAVQ